MAASWAGFIADLDPRLAILVAAIPSAIPGVWVWWQWRVKRADEREDRELTREERRGRELDTQQTTFGAEQGRWFADLRQENRDLRMDLIETRRDRDRGWELARYWHGTAHDVLRHYRNCRHNAVNMMQWIIMTVARFSGMKDSNGNALVVMPETIEPVPDRIDLPMGLEDPK